MLIPKARGAYSETLFTGMRAGELEAATRPPDLPESSEDLHIALWAMYELHYQGFEDVSPGLEWHPDLLRTRIELEQAFELTLRGRFSPTACAGNFASDFFDFVANHEGASLSAYVQRDANRDEVLDLLRAKSIYHLKESDPTAWVVARLPVVAKAALVELLYDEYGGGDPNRVHSHLFAQGLTASGLSSTYGAYIDDASLEVLEDNNAMSLFGLNRRLRAAAAGHLAAFEATSSMPSRRMAQGLSRLGFPPEMVHYYEEHVEADAVHEQLAVRGVCGSLVASEPELREEVFFGAFTCLDLGARFATSMLAQWEA